MIVTVFEVVPALRIPIPYKIKYNCLPLAR